MKKITIIILVLCICNLYGCQTTQTPVISISPTASLQPAIPAISSTPAANPESATPTPSIQNDINETESPDIDEENTVKQDLVTHEQIIGTWIRKHFNRYYDEVLQTMIFEDGSFISDDEVLIGMERQDGASYLSGRWQISEDQIVFIVEDQLVIHINYEENLPASVERIPVEKSFSSEPALLEMTDDEMTIGEIAFQKYIYEINSSPENGNIKFDGKWNRTNTHRAVWGSVQIIDKSDEYIFFDACVGLGGRLGFISGAAKRTGTDNAEYINMYVNEPYDDEIVYIKFHIKDDLLYIESNGTCLSLGFGMGVYIDGEYTQGDVTYTNEGILQEVFQTDERLKAMKSFLGEDRWKFLKYIIEYGFHYEEDITYSGYVYGLGQGANFLMTDDMKIYYMSYGEGLPDIYATNDELFLENIPESIWPTRNSFHDIRYIYKGKDEEIVVDNCLWINHKTEEPGNYNNPENVLWVNSEGPDYIEIYVDGAIYDIDYIVQVIDGESGEVVEENLRFSEDYIENKTLIIRTDLGNGNREYITFTDPEDNQYTYYLERLSNDDAYINRNKIIAIKGVPQAPCGH